MENVLLGAEVFVVACEQMTERAKCAGVSVYRCLGGWPAVKRRTAVAVLDADGRRIGVLLVTSLHHGTALLT